MSRHWPAVLLMLLVVSGFYARVSRSYFCGYDDFLEIGRAAVEDTRDPSRIFTTTHFQTSKYRPLNRLLIFATYHLGDGSPLWFRMRNLGFHLLAAAMVYGLGWQLFHSRSTAFASALLFGLCPLSNQCVVASSWTITAGYALMLSALFLFFYALKAGRHALFWLTLALVGIWLSLFIYEATIVIFAFMYGYLAIEWWSSRRQPASNRLLLFLTLGSAVVGVTFFAARFMVVSSPLQVVRPASIVKNAAMYGGALLLPIDSVLAHALFNAPLPPEIRMNGATLALTIAAAGVVLLAALAVYFFQPLRNRLAQIEWPKIGFLAFCCGFSLLPFLFFTDHASETYLYLPAAFYVLLVAGILRTLLPGSANYTVAVALIGLCYGAGTWLRNEDVSACGATAQRIMAGMPLANWRQGVWRIRVANFSGEPTQPRFGIYQYQGLSTIDVGDPKVSSIEPALQLATRNPNISAQVISPEEMRSCSPADTCFWVHQDGQVEPLHAMKDGSK
jgi:hypothetical protein